MIRPRVAAIVTEYRPRSHADVIVGKMLEGYLLDGVPQEPRLEVASLYLDQTPDTDIGRALAAKYRVPVYGTIGEALTLGGNGPLVDGAVLVGEHGNYPYNTAGQHMYPRRRFFDAAVSTMASRQRFIPIFTDKHLSWSFDDAQYMVRTAKRLGIPMLAGSSLPLAWRKPAMHWSLGDPVTQALGVGYSDLDSYGFHALEMVQCMVERRTGGETGVRSVQCLEGDAVWRGGSKGAWSEELLKAALATLSNVPYKGLSERVKEPAAILIEYRDGLRAAVLQLSGATEQFAFAANRNGAVEATNVWLEPQEPFGHFAFLVRQIETLVLDGQPAYPIERTLLTTGILAYAMRSRELDHVALDTPDLDIRYAAPETDYGAG